MSRLKNAVRRALRLPGVPEARHVAERAVAPYLRADLTSLHQTILELNHRLTDAEQKVNVASGIIRDVEHHQPAVLNAIASTNGTARLLRRELDATNAELENLRASLADERDEVQATFLQERSAATKQLDEVRGAIDDARSQAQRMTEEMRPHIGTLAWLVERVETVRAEMLHELRYGRPAVDEASVEVEVVNADALNPSADGLRLNLGCGHLPLDGYVNVDMRELPGVDVVAPIDALPVEAGSVAEIFSAHFLEHFPHEQLRRSLLPYWRSVLRPGGTFRAVVPDVDSMIDQYKGGEISFENLRQVAYGGQEYEGDFHFTAFTPDSLRDLLDRDRIRPTSSSSSGHVRTATAWSSSCWRTDRADAGLGRHLHVQPRRRSAGDAAMPAPAAIP